MGIGELSGNHMTVLGLMLVVLAIIVRRVASRARGSSRGNPLEDVQKSFARIEQSVPGRVLQAEVRLHDIARDVEARIETRMLVLDQMIISADREIRRLQDKLDELGMPDPHSTVTGSSPDRRFAGGSSKSGEPGSTGQTILALAARGMSPEVIADTTGQPIARVIALIETARSIDRRDAA